MILNNSTSVFTTLGSRHSEVPIPERSIAPNAPKLECLLMAHSGRATCAHECLL